MGIFVDAAYKKADGAKIDGRRVVVDYERGRTQKTWLPRRLGGGKGDTRRTREPKKAVTREEDRSNGYYPRDEYRAYSRDKDNGHQHGGSSSRHRSRSRDRDRNGDRRDRDRRR